MKIGIGILMCLVAPVTSTKYIVKLRSHAREFGVLDVSTNNAIGHGREARIGRKFDAHIVDLNKYQLEWVKSEASKVNGRVEYFEKSQPIKHASDMTCDTNTPSAQWSLGRITSVATPTVVPSNVDAAPLPFDHDPNWGNGVDAYVLDSGINCNHVEFTSGNAQCFFGTNVASDAPDPVDYTGHGSFIAGVIAGKTVGLAKSTKLINVKVSDNNGIGDTGTMLSGVSWVVANKNTARHSIINLSIIAGLSRALNDAFEAAVQEGVNIVVAAGNGNEVACTFSPGSAPGVITVGMSDRHDVMVQTPTFGSNYGLCVDIFAPGAHITSISHVDTTSMSGGAGTSFATPHVVAAVAAFLTNKPVSTKPSEVRSWVHHASLKDILQEVRGSPNKLLHIPCGQSWPPATGWVNSGYRTEAKLVGASQSSEYSIADSLYAGDGTAEKAIDGNFDTFTFTFLGQGQTWSAGFAPHRVTRVVIWNRKNCCQDRLSEFTITIGGVSRVVRSTVSDDDSEGSSFEFGETLGTNIVITQDKVSDSFLSIGEVKIYGTPVKPLIALTTTSTNPGEVHSATFTSGNRHQVSSVIVKNSGNLGSLLTNFHIVLSVDEFIPGTPLTDVANVRKVRQVTQLQFIDGELFDFEGFEAQHITLVTSLGSVVVSDIISVYGDVVPSVCVDVMDAVSGDASIPFSYIPTVMETASVYSFTGGIAAGYQIRLECCGSQDCDFFLSVYHCPPCSTSRSGGYPGSLPVSLWTPGLCSPLFTQGAHTYPTATFHKRVTAGSVELLPPTTTAVPYVAIFNLRGSTGPVLCRTRGPIIPATECLACFP